MDNLEWVYGYTTPFGLVHVDFETRARRVKLSGHIYAKIARLSEPRSAKSGSDATDRSHVE